MILFDPEDPFPLLSAPDYAAEKIHSAQVDQWLGIETEKLEALESSMPQVEGKNLWVGLPSASLLTPYTELREILSRIKPKAGETFVDLGAAYGRMAFVLARHHPDVSFIGYELSERRVKEGVSAFERSGLGRARLILQDLAAPGFTPVPACYYFVYDFGLRTDLEKTLSDLRAIAGTRAITVIGRGRLVRDLIERSEPWLSQVIPAEHHGRYSIYRSAFVENPF